MERNDQPEDDQVADDQQDVADADDVGRRRVTEFDARLTECEHTGVDDSAAMVASAKAIERWEEAPAEREWILRHVGGEMMTVHEAPPPELQVKEMPAELRGEYNDEDFRIDENARLVGQSDPHDALETYLHEYRHAEQAYEVQASHGALAHRVDAVRSAEVEFNTQHYIDGRDDYPNYRGQLMEADARAFAEATTAKILQERDALRAAEVAEVQQPVDVQPPVDANDVAARRVAEAYRQES
jgi:hypothetical protein